ncbi:MAG: PspA-associated protein PspAA [Thermacetogeniaceae bacterium]
MIIRILTEGQYRLEGEALAELDRIDNSLLDALQKGDEAEFLKRLEEVVSFVKKRGEPLPDSELVESDLIIPAPDTTLEEARELFTSYPRDLI